MGERYRDVGREGDRLGEREEGERGKDRVILCLTSTKVY